MASDDIYGLAVPYFLRPVTWMPVLLQAKGMNESMAGWMLSLMQYIAMPPMMLAPMLADRLRDQRGIVAAVCVVYAEGLAGLFANTTPLLIVAIVCISLAQGTAMGLSLTFIGMRAANVRDIAIVRNGSIHRLPHRSRRSPGDTGSRRGVFGSTRSHD